jgi:hypothetical protein
MIGGGRFAIPGAARSDDPRGIAKTASGFDAESSTENPKNNERTKGQPGGKKFRTCSEI